MRWPRGRIGMCGYTAVPADGRTCYYYYCHRYQQLRLFVDLVSAVPSHDRQTSRGNVPSPPPHVTPGVGDDKNEVDDETDEDEEDAEAGDSSADEQVCIQIFRLHLNIS